MDLIHYILEIEADAVVVAGRIISEYYKNNPTSKEARKFLQTLNEQTSSKFTIVDSTVVVEEEPNLDEEIYNLAFIQQYMGV